jgi:hypothetical protein
MKSLISKGYENGLFPFSPSELKLFESASDEIRDLPLEQRKNVFASHPQLRVFIDNSLRKLKLNAISTNYCFYIEKNIDQNWPLALHQDLNFPPYLNEDEGHNLHQKGFWLRLSLDKSNEKSGALKVVPGSHINSVKNKATFLNNEAGEVILFKPLLFHGSNKMTTGQRRRVFQVLCKDIKAPEKLS